MGACDHQRGTKPQGGGCIKASRDQHVERKHLRNRGRHFGQVEAAAAGGDSELSTEKAAAGVPTTSITQSRSAGASAPHKDAKHRLEPFLAAATCGSCQRSCPKGGTVKRPGVPPAARPERSEPEWVGDKMGEVKAGMHTIASRSPPAAATCGSRRRRRPRRGGDTKR